MAVTFYSNGEVSEVRWEGRVLSVSRWTYHVPSDNAMIDSGEGQEVQVWDDGRVVSYFISTGRDGEGCYKTFAVDAPEDVQAAAAAWGEIFGWLERVASGYRHHQYVVAEARRRPLRKGDRVEVFKGRKCPKGQYWVVSAGEGDYGPYANLSDDKLGMSAVFYRYVSQDNMRRLGNPEDEVGVFQLPSPPFPASRDVLAAAHGVMPLVPGNLGRTPAPWPKTAEAPLAALADAFEDAWDDDRAAVVRAHLESLRREWHAVEAAL